MASSCVIRDSAETPIREGGKIYMEGRFGRVGDDMPEVLTFDEIKERCGDEWVLIGDPELADTLEVRAGVLLFHSKDREAIHKFVQEMKRGPEKGRIAILFLGEIPENTAILL